MLKQKSKVISITGKRVFASGTGGKKDGGRLRKIYRRAIESAGIEDFRFHDLRHTFATRLAQSGIDIFLIAKLLGHRTLSMVMRYARHCPESLRQGVNVLTRDYNLTTVAGVVGSGLKRSH